ncbi:hypothetical protein BX666DRAFT_1966772 [Dichotomocladium elegans]|nr:hypothetical protein BX666DRAFT_1966772 [Dichotomocladium elegans]
MLDRGARWGRKSRCSSSCEEDPARARQRVCVNGKEKVGSLHQHFSSVPWYSVPASTQQISKRP